MCSLRLAALAASLVLGIAAPAGATLVTGTFTGTVSDNFNDPDGLTYISQDMQVGDSLTGSYSFDTAAISGGSATNTLLITITDTNTRQGWTYYDSGSLGAYGDGSYYVPAAGSYTLQADSGLDGNDVSQSVTLDFISPEIHAGAYAQNFAIGAGSGSYGQILGDFFYGVEDGYVNFSIVTATMSAPVPEPAPYGIFALAVLALAWAHRRASSGRLASRRSRG